MIPGIDGIDVCRKVREIPRNLPIYIILLTSMKEKENIVAGLDAGADDYIVKLFDNNELRSRIGVGKKMIKLQMSLVERALELKEALGHVKTLQGILPICVHCIKYVLLMIKSGYGSNNICLKTQM